LMMRREVYVRKDDEEMLAEAKARHGGSFSSLVAEAIKQWLKRRRAR
jgi:hypothetical protein